MRQSIVYTLSVAGVAIFIATSARAFSVPQIESSVSDEIEVVTKADDDIQKRIQEADTLIKHNYAYALRKAYDKNTIYDNIKAVEEVPEQYRGEYYESIYYYFGPLIKNYGIYTSEVNALITRCIEIIETSSNKYDSMDAERKEGLKRKLKVDISLFKDKGVLNSKLDRNVDPKQQKPLPFKYSQYWKDDYQTIPFLNDRLNETISCLEQFQDALGKTKDIKTVGANMVSNLENIRKKLNGFSLKHDNIESGKIFTEAARPGENVKVTQRNNVKPTGEIKKTQVNLPKVKTPIKLSSLKEIKASLDKMKSEDAKKSELSANINEIEELLESMQIDRNKAQKTLDNASKNYETANTQSKFFKSKVDQAQGNLDDIDKKIKDIEKFRDELKALYKTMFHEDYSPVE